MRRSAVFLKISSSDVSFDLCIRWIQDDARVCGLPLRFSHLINEIVPETFEVHGRIVQGDNAVASASNVCMVKATGKKFENDFALHFTVSEKGKISRFHVYEDGYAINEAFTA